MQSVEGSGVQLKQAPELPQGHPPKKEPWHPMRCRVSQLMVFVTCFVDSFSRAFFQFGLFHCWLDDNTQKNEMLSGGRPRVEKLDIGLPLVGAVEFVLSTLLSWRESPTPFLSGTIL